ncbi:iron uptake porin [Gloeocapsopsis sp. IPPAS B-1203]|uniref:iron uptake porin n=1 Tax=Gloeocapsopsis sp. IPPAS B-1203 TaxID=2049454 RepID=UPI000C180DFE|nr:iron uptake porin [Gloeocapsopsis sp. IPPAS B-1203]PIG93083.1 hypothetical protein CSQ79_12815 [Gloeocapsopsis sp. IPPAS B-1203]
MTKFFWNALRLSPVILGATLLLGNRVQATETPVVDVVVPTATTDQAAAVEPAPQIVTSQAPTLVSQVPANSLAQVTSVSQLSDVQPTDWAFQALQSLVERYGCIAGYPDGTYRGNRALTRYEFAAGLNACLDRVNELIATATADQVTREDLATLQRLQEEFAAEIATLRGRVDALEAQTAELEANQFSTTTVLNGEVIFAISDVFGDAAVGGEDLEYNTVLGGRARLNFDTSFGGDDRLRVRLQAANLDNNSGETGTSMTRLGFDTNTGNDVELEDFYYRFPVGDAALVQLNFSDVGLDNALYSFNPSLESSGRGAISRYGRFSPIYRTGSGAGISVSLNPEGPLTVTGVFAAPNAADPGEGGVGLFNGAYTALGQIGFRISDAFTIGATYARSYQNTASGIDLFGSTGSANANAPFGEDVATEANHYGAQASLQLGQSLNLSGWVGYSTADSLVGPAADADMFYWAATLALQDFGREGNQLGIIFGQPPKVTDSALVEDPDTSYHLEGVYRLQLTENVAITPGVLVIFNPEHNNANDTIYVGTLRTTFSF